MKIGIFFGGPSREREISFAGGRTVYDNLNKALFEPVPIFIDSWGNFILLNWQYLYKGTIRDFYPPVSATPHSRFNFQIYAESLGKLSPEAADVLIRQVGRRVQPEEFASLMDFAFLALHGPYGEDGAIQGLLEWYGIPYSGAGILPSAIGIDKIAQKRLLAEAGFATPKSQIIQKTDWLEGDQQKIWQEAKAHLGLPLVVKSPHQGSSIGVNVVEEDTFEAFSQAMHRCLFIEVIKGEEWSQWSAEEKRLFLMRLIDIREGIGLPVALNGEWIFHPDELYDTLETLAKPGTTLYLHSEKGEVEVLLESFISGKEFSCIVIEDPEGNPMALPPTEIRKGREVFDYRSKYLPGMSRKITPMQVPDEQIMAVRKACEKLFLQIYGDVYARIDGFLDEKGTIYLNDPNTTSGMLPSSFFFHQAAEIGLNPSQFLTYIIRTSLAARLRTGKQTDLVSGLMQQIDAGITALHQQESDKMRVGVIMGGFSTERHISVESGRNIFEKLSSSTKYKPLPIFLSGNEQKHRLFTLPINIMLKDNADDIREKLLEAHGENVALEAIRKEAAPITDKYAEEGIIKAEELSYDDLAQRVDAVFIALHGRPGEDGAVQTELEKYHIPYNGSGVPSSQVTINKYDTNEKLKAAGIAVAEHRLVWEADWKKDIKAEIDAIEAQFSYPFIAKPADDGCSSAVKKVKNREELEAFATMMFRPQPEFPKAAADTLKLKRNEEFPQKNFFLIEELVTAKGAAHFLEITGGLLTHWNTQGELEYEVFEPSEALVLGEVLSLEEKFLAGEGQNITPARFASSAEAYQKVSEQVKATLQKTAKVLQVEGYARIDAFVRIYDDLRAETIIIEVNSLPGMTPATCIFHQSAINGYTPYGFIDEILQFGIQRNRKLTHS